MNRLTICKNLVDFKYFMREHSSNEWLARQKSDPYVEKAKMKNYRCRSAFKLLQIDDKHSILKPGQCVIDIGAAPGSWTQVAVSRINSDSQCNRLPVGLMIGIDLQQMFPINGAILLGNCDFTSTKTWEKINKILCGQLLDVVMSDMAPNATGVKHLDHDLIIKMAYSVLKFSIINSKIGSTCLVKIWDGNQNKELEKSMLKFYSTVKYVKPEASRSDSAEKYLLARGFKGLVKLLGINYYISY
ncbi:rRNA methyltransferase 2, mitochondrial isoform X3 [Daktulosphaira vitifoliae]|uniref:rRNA methyltransferase 2, mitochondrial isoform X3 n=1 Tax=Daktulosphaira vitifoliae TaxID=58002 RepID=UPI0021AADC8B|nr:rRNA methyltransferase 2, mitochondrial isoform X3 [Daktulosphaira vitifoliae]